MAIFIPNTFLYDGYAYTGGSITWNNPQRNPSSCKKTTMDIPIAYEDGTENEISIELCCATCAKTAYGISELEYNQLVNMARNGPQLKVPYTVSTVASFIEFVKKL
jgi:hypothetical protein